jgi:predicted RNase H-like nuclease (RuvC/YqgF family)
MEQKDSKIFNKETLGSVESFCKLNNIEDKEDFIYLCFKQGFDIKKFGLLGETLNEGEKHLKTGGIQEKRVEIEVIREIRVEIPVEVIKEVEKIVEVIKEVTVEKVVIKEVPVDRVVEKIIYTTDNIQINELGGKIAKLEQELSTKTTEIENIFQNRMSKKDEELDELRQKLDDPVTNNKLNMLQNTLQNLRNDLSLKNDKINELEKINQELQKTANLQNAIYMKGSNLNSRI